MFDYSKLKGLMVEKGYTQERLAREIGITPSTLTLKLNNESDFRSSEIMKIASTFGIVDRVSEYFFCDSTRENAS